MTVKRKSPAHEVGKALDALKEIADAAQRSHSRATLKQAQENHASGNPEQEGNSQLIIAHREICRWGRILQLCGSSKLLSCFDCYSGDQASASCFAYFGKSCGCFAPGSRVFAARPSPAPRDGRFAERRAPNSRGRCSRSAFTRQYSASSLCATKWH